MTVTNFRLLQRGSLGGVSFMLVLIFSLYTPQATSQIECDNWQLTNPLPINRDLNGVAYRDGAYVVVGDEGIVLTSPDVVSWRQLPPVVEVDLNAVLQQPDGFLVFGDDGAILNGGPEIGWQVAPAPTTEDLLDAASNEGSTLVAVGTNGAIVTSFDHAATWALQESGTIFNLNAVVWTGSEYFAVGDEGTIVQSADGSTWSQVEVSVALDFTAVASNDSLTLVFTDYGTVVSTTGDGSWSQRLGVGRVTDAIWYGDRFLTVGASHYSQRYSFDGISWFIYEASIPGLSLNTIGPAWNNQKTKPAAVGAGPTGTIAHTTDGGRHWKGSNTVAGVTLRAMAATDTLAVMVAGNTTLVSHDLTNWELHTHNPNTDFRDIAANADVFMAVGHTSSVWGGNGFIWTSTDGVNWVSSTPNPKNVVSYNCIIWDGHRWIAGGGSTLFVSYDGSNWQKLDFERSGYYSGLASNGSFVAAVGPVGWIGVSSGGTVRPVEVGNDLRLLDAAWGNEVFVAVGEAGSIMTSTSGHSWQKRVSGVTADLSNVRWTGEFFVAVGTGGIALTSVTGETWQPLNLGTDADLTDLMVTTLGTLACGENGLILRLACASLNQGPTARFAWRPTQTEVGVPVRFVDLSMGSPTGWLWDFGGGAAASGSTATHVFSEHGDHSVNLIVNNTFGSDSATARITVRRVCSAPPPLTLRAPDQALSGQPYTISWDSTLDDWESGEFKIFESRDPSFTRAVETELAGSATSFDASHPWTEGGVFFYRAMMINQCPDGAYTSVASNTVDVDIEPELSELGEYLWVIPAASTSSGLAGASWVSDVSIHNANEFDAPVYLIHLPRKDEGTATLGTRLSVPANRSLHLEDALEPFGEDIDGALLVASDRPLHVISRTFNAQPEGSYGQFVDGVLADDTPESGREDVFIQLTENQNYRSNLALANPLPQPVVVEVEAFAASGEMLGVTTHTIPGMSTVFETQFLQQFTSDPISDAYAIVTRTSPDGRVAALASVIDTRTGDPVAQPAYENRLEHRVAVIEQPPVLSGWPDWKDLIFAHGRWVLVGFDGIAISCDGVHWELVVDMSDTNEGLLKLAFNGSRILAFSYRTLLTSDDGENWTSRPIPDFSLGDVTWDGTRWFGIVESWGDSIATSTDGITWQAHEIQEDTRLESVIYGGGRYVAATAYGAAHSIDGLVWERIDLGDRLQKVAWNGARYLGIGYKFIALSDDGQSWEIQTTERVPHDVVWANDRWVVGAGYHSSQYDEPSAFMVSVDGEDWETFPRPEYSAHDETVAFNGATVMAVDSFSWITFLVSDTPTITVPVVAHGDGLGGTRWRSDLELYNPHDLAVGCTIELLPRDSGTVTPMAIEIPIEAMTSLRFNDVVHDLFGIDGAGALRITPVTNTVMASSRSYDNVEDGTYGQLVPGLKATDAIWPFDTGRLIGLAHSPSPDIGFRTNVGLVSACDQPMDISINLFDGNGLHLGNVSSHLHPFEVRQLNNLFRRVTEDQVSNGFAILTTGDSLCSFYAYASVIDNRTNDPVLIPAVP